MIRRYEGVRVRRWPPGHGGLVDAPRVSRCRVAFTLIEALVSITVVVTLSLILLPVLIGARQQAKHGRDLESMRRIGQVWALYTENSGVRARSLFHLVEAGVLPKESCSGLGDPTDIGISNELMRLYRQNLGELALDRTVYPRDYRISFVGSHEAKAPDSIVQGEGELSSVGWLVNVAPGKLELPGSTYGALELVGRYQRLLDSGSVVIRPFYSESFTHSNGKPSTCRASPWLFADFSQEERVGHCRKYTTTDPQ